MAKGTLRVGLAVALAALLAPVAPLLSQNSSGECGVEGQIEDMGNGWTSIRAPGFPRGAAALTAYAVTPFMPTQIFATNGRVIMRSIDGGCTWVETFRIPNPSPGGVLSSNSEIESIFTPVSPAGTERVFALVKDATTVDIGGVEVGAVQVLRSSDGGTSWELSSDGHFPHGSPIELVAVESRPDTMYLATLLDFPEPVGSKTLIYRSEDAGRAWDAVVSIDPVGLPPEFTDIAADPFIPALLWGASPEGLWRSGDGGVTWESIPQIDTPKALVDIFHEPGSDASVWALAPGSVRSEDGGDTWNSMPDLPLMNSVAHGSTADQMFATTRLGDNSAAYGFSRTVGDWILLRGMVGEDLRGASADRQVQPTFYAHSRFRIWAYSPSSDDFEVPGEPGEAEGGGASDGCAGDYDGFVEIDPRVAKLAPGSLEVILAPGEQETVPYELSLPKSPSPVDLYFLIDASRSMEPALCGAASSASEIVSRLVADGVDVRLGVGTYQDFPPPSDPRRPPDGCYSYRRHLDLVPLSDVFAATLNQLATCGGNEPQMTSLRQAVVGDGHAGIPPGMNAHFRSEAIRLVVHISDEGIENFNNNVVPCNTYNGCGDRKPWPLHNTPDEAIEALKERGIMQVGLYGFYGAQYWMPYVARETGAIAVEPGVDCNGDGDPEVPPGNALVCPMGKAGPSGTPMADPIVGFVRAIKDEADVSLREASDSGVVTKIQPDIHSGVNLRQENLLPFEVTYKCTADQAGQVFPVTLSAERGTDAVASAEAIVSCLELPEPPGEIPGTEIPPVIPGIAAPPPLPPPPPLTVAAPAPGPAPAPAAAPGPAPAPAAQPQPIPQPNPQVQPNPQAQANPQAQTQAQAGLATQKQEQAQTAMARAAEKVAEQEEYSMTARSRREPSRMPLAAGGAMALGFGCVALAVRRRTQRAEARWH